MATTISTQDIVDAKRDIDDIGKAVNEKVIVSPRYGEDFKSLPMIAEEFQISSDAAEAAAQSAQSSASAAEDSANNASSSANIAEAAATAATISAGVFDTPEAGVDPVTGVADGDYFNVRSSSDESYIDEYQNVGGVATPTGKSYPSGSYVETIAKYTALPFKQGKSYALHERVQLANGDIVKSTVDGNTNDPNVDMTGWIHEDYGLVKSFISLEEIEQDPYDGQIIFIKARDNGSNGFFSGHFRFVSGSTETVDNGIIFNATGGRWIRVLSGTINPLMFGNKSNSDQIIINKAIIACKRFKQKLDLSVSGWDIDGEIKFYEYDRIYVISSQDSIINCLASGTYTNGYCVEFGKANFDPFTYRMVGAVIDGNLWIRTDRQETTVLHGAYLKGSWLNIDYVRGEGFNGTGINADSVFDSNIRHLSSEVCGNSNNYAMIISSQGDTTNCTTFSNLQIEQAQQKILQINAVRTTILNIHQERATIANDTNVNIDILLSNSTIEQAVFDSLSNVIDIKLNLDVSTASNIYAAHARVKSDYGTHGIFNTLVAIGYEQVATASKVTLNSPVIIDYISVEGGCNVNGGTIKDVKNSYNCRDLNFYGTAIESVNLNQNILGDITFNECPIKNVYETKSPATNYKKTTFNDCNIDNFVGAYNGQARVNGGFIKTVNLTSQALVDFVDVEGVTFSASGNIGYLTRNCSFSGSVSWSLPTISCPAGTVTERIGYDAAGKIYQNTASGVNWVKIA